MSNVSVHIDTEVEAFPVLDINRTEPKYDVGRNYAIPAAMLDRLEQAEAEVKAAKFEIMRYVAEEHPEAEEVHDWLGDREG